MLLLPPAFEVFAGHIMLGRFSEAEGEEKYYSYVISGSNNMLRLIEGKALLATRPTCYLLLVWYQLYCMKPN